MLKSLFENELMSSMQKELHKYASDDKQPNLTQAAECLHAALEILEQQGMRARADQVLQLLEKIGQQNVPVTKTAKIHSLKQLMEAGITQRDLFEFSKGSPRAAAKLNLTLRKLGLSDHEIAKFLGPTHVMSEEEAREKLNPNKPGSLVEFKSLSPDPAPSPKSEEFLEFKSIAGSKKKSKDPATRGLTSKKETKNLLHHGHPLNVTLADDNGSIRVPPSINKDTLSADDLDPDFVDMLSASTFDIDASDDELMGMEIADDSLEVFDNDTVLESFEEERD